MKRFLAIALLAAHALAGTPAHAQGSPDLSVTGSLVDARTFSAETLKQLPQQEIADSRSIERDGVRQTRRIVYRGVWLRDVILAAGFRENQRHDFRMTLFVATASDGKPLPAGEGPFALRASGDIRPGARHIRWMKEINVMQVER